MKLDEIDYKILDILQENGRITNVQLSQQVGLSPAPTLERVRKLENSEFIESYHALLNAQRLGLNVTVFAEVTLGPGEVKKQEAFLADMQRHREVVECYRITGEYDFLLKIFATDIAGYQTFIMNHIVGDPHGGKVSSKIVLATPKRTLSLPIPVAEE